MQYLGIHQLIIFTNEKLIFEKFQEKIPFLKINAGTFEKKLSKEGVVILIDNTQFYDTSYKLNEKRLKLF